MYNIFKMQYIFIYDNIYFLLYIDIMSIPYSSIMNYGWMASSQLGNRIRTDQSFRHIRMHLAFKVGGGAISMAKSVWWRKV